MMFIGAFKQPFTTIRECNYSSPLVNIIFNIMSSRTSSNFDENRWIIQIRQTLEDELDDDTDIPVSIFTVPKSLMLSNPDFYIPQEIALGPYHHFRSELGDMERYKLLAAKRIQKQHQSRNFQNLVGQLSVCEGRIRAVYHKYLDFNSVTLMWIMAMDASFLLEFLQIYAVNEGKVFVKLPSKLSYLVDVAGRKSSHNAILRDIVMLENQIPLFFLRKMLELQYSSLEQADKKLLSMMFGFCEELSPFKMVGELCNSTDQMMECAHLLDFLYHVIIPKSNTPPSEIAEIDDQDLAKVSHDQSRCCSFGQSSYVKRTVQLIWMVLAKLNDGPIRLIKKIIFSKPLKVLIKFPWTIISTLPFIRVLKQPIESIFFNTDQKEDQEKPESGSRANKPPLMEEISIPSVNELANVGVKFLPTNEGILSITFDAKTSSFYLPPINLNVNAEVVLRNLVAYEACNASRLLILTRYTELMNGIIDNEDDVKFLREKGIIFNRLKSDTEVANLWNGMSRSVILTKVPFLDNVIEDVNKHYNGKIKVKIGKFMKKYVFESWQCLTLIAAVILLLLMTLQAFCSVYSCTRMFHIQQMH